MCEPIREQLAAYAAGTLSAAAERAVVDHLARCSACRAEADGWLAVAAAVRRRAAAQRDALPPYRAPLPAPAHASASPAALAPAPAPQRGRLAGGIAMGGHGASGRFDGASLRRWLPRVAATMALAAGLGAIGLLASRAPGRLAERSDRDGPATAPQAGTLAAAERAATPVQRLSARDGTASQPGAGGIVGREETASTAAAGRDANAAAIGRTAAPPGQDAAPAGHIAEDAVVPATAPATTPTAAPDVAPVAPDPGAPERPEQPERPEPTDRARPSSTPVIPSETAQPPETVAPPDNPTATPEAQAPTAVAPPATSVPAIAGTVHDGNGAPLAGARVFAEVASGGAEVVAETDALGRYAVAVTGGSWLVHVEAAGHALMWRAGKPTPLDADAFDAAEAGAVDFYLEPAAAWAIRGRVVDASGAPVARALVVAAPPDRSGGGGRRPSAAAFSDAAGQYVLPVPTGAWLVATTLDWRGGALTWWGGDGSLAMADTVPVGDDSPSDGIDLMLQP